MCVTSVLLYANPVDVIGFKSGNDPNTLTNTQQFPEFVPSQKLLGQSAGLAHLAIRAVSRLNGLFFPMLTVKLHDQAQFIGRV